MNPELHSLILLIIISLVRGQNNETNATSNEIPKTVQNITTTPKPTWSSLDTICNQTETCQQYNEIKTDKPEYQDLRTRKCMCDTHCRLYGDCCEDSILHNTSSQINISFACKRMPFDGYVYIANNECAPDYSENPKIIENCHTTNISTLLQNYLLMIPVTNVQKKITYANVFCAICNHELIFDFWQPIFAYRRIENQFIDIVAENSSDSLRTNQTKYEAASWESIFNNITIDVDGKQLISQVGGSSYSCQILPNIAETLVSGIRYCLSDSNDRTCSVCENRAPTNSCVAEFTYDYGELVILHESRLYSPKFDMCNEVPTNVSHKNVFCKEKEDAPVATKTPNNIEKCFFQNATGSDCLVSTFYGPDEYKFLENGSLYVYRYPYAFPPAEYTNKTSILNVTYVCGTVIPKTEKDKFYEKVELILNEIFVKFSIFFSFLYLVTNLNKQKLQSLPNKILFSFCITLFFLYVVLELAEPDILSKQLCKIAGVCIHYLYLSCFTWLLIASYDFWQVICRSSTKLQTLAGKTRMRRYLLYCFFGWISPLSIIAVSLYCEWSLIDTVACIYKPGYGRLQQCFMAQYYAKRYLFLYPSCVMFCAILALFAHTSYHIYLSKRKNIKSTAQNNYYMLFMKLALTMGLTWTIGMIVTFTGSNIFTVIYVILNASHGSLMFFAYGFKCTMLTKVYDKHKNNTIVQQTKSTFFSITDKVRSSTSQPSTSIDHPTQELESTN